MPVVVGPSHRTEPPHSTDRSQAIGLSAVAPDQQDDQQHDQLVSLECGLLVDLRQITLDELRTAASAQLATSTERILAQIERPRVNLGGAGPPGRAD
jgi:hypothetical protein